MGSKPPRTGDRVQALKSGDRRVALEAMRDELVEAFVEASPNVVAQIAGRLQAVLLEIENLPAAKKVSKADELAKRRVARRSGPNNTVSAAGEGSE